MIVTFKRQQYLAPALLGVLMLVLIHLPEKTSSRAKLAISSLFLPLFGLAGSAQQLAGGASEALMSRKELAQQNEKLRLENQQLKLNLQQSEQVAKENERLRKLVGWQQQQKWKLKLARVILREPANWWRTVQIDLGSKDGMEVNLPVLNFEGALVGRIHSVGPSRSQVVLLGDPNCKVAARVENEGRDTGVIGSGGPLENDFVEMSYLSRSAKLAPGQNIKTSGEGGIFPADIPIGKVVDARPAEYGLITSARVKLNASLNNLQEVWVRLK